MNRHLATFLAPAAVLFFFAAVTATCQTEQPRLVKPGTKVGLAEWKPTQQEVSTSYWTLEPGWNTELEIRNNLAERKLTVTPVLRTAGGREIALPDVVLASDEVTSIDLSDALAKVAPELPGRVGSFGSAAVRFAGLNDRNVFAASMVYREGHPIDFHFDGYDAASNDGYFSGIEGIWWLPNSTATDFLIVSNPSRKTINGTLVLSGDRNNNKQVPLKLGPLQTWRIDIREALGNSIAGEMGALTLLFPNKEGLSASQIVFDETTGLAAIMKLFERDESESAQAHVLRAPMMALREPDVSLAYPKDTVLSPRLFLRNAGQSKLQVTAAIRWRSQTGEGTYNYPALSISSSKVSIIDLGLLQDSGAIPANANWANVTLSYTGKSADLVPVAISYDSKQRYGLQSPFTEGTNRMFKGGMWHVDSTHGTIITTGNGGSENTKAQVTLFYDSGKGRYRIEKLLLPNQQILLDIGQLIRNQIPDSDGNVIPLETMTGSYELRDLDHPAVGLLYEGKLTIDKTFGHASYGCGTCCGYYNTRLTPNPFSGPASFNNQDYYLAQEQCGGYWDDFTGSAYSWYSTNTAVATLPNSMLHTVAIGTATGSAQNLLQATHPAPACPQAVMNGSQPVSVVSVAMSLQSSGTIASDNSARDLYEILTGTYSLGIQTTTQPNFKACIAGLQLTGTVTPSTYAGTIQLKRTLVSCGVYHSSNVADTCTPGDDTSATSNEDEDPQSGGSMGKVYDWDTPGKQNGNSANSVYRFRANFSEYAVANGVTVSAAPVNFYVRVSCKFDASGNPSLDTTVAGDNQAGTGTTATTWNLQ